MQIRHTMTGNVAGTTRAGTGTLEVRLPARFLGSDLEVAPAGTDGLGQPLRVACVQGPSGSRDDVTLVFTDLVEGTYDLSLAGTGQVALTALVVESAVTRAAWPH